MKFNKLSMLLLAGIFFFSFVSCTKAEDESVDMEPEVLERVGNELEQALSSMSEGAEMMVEETVDTVLDQYEELVGEYIDVYQKVKEGAADAGVELNKLVEKNQELVTNLGLKAAEMSEEQRKRFEDLVAKLAAAAQ